MLSLREDVIRRDAGPIRDTAVPKARLGETNGSRPILPLAGLEARGGLLPRVETCGYSSWAHFERILPYTDLFLYDIKHIDPEKHRRQTGVDNALILDNFKKLCQNGAEIIVRIPIVPGFNNSADEIQRIVSYVNAQDHIREIHLLPYHRLGLPKYKALEQEYVLEELEPISLQLIRDLKKFIAQDRIGIKIEV